MQVGDERIATEEVPSAFLSYYLRLIEGSRCGNGRSHIRKVVDYKMVCKQSAESQIAKNELDCEFEKTFAQPRSEDYDNRVSRTTVPLRKPRVSLRSNLISTQKEEKFV